MVAVEVAGGQGVGGQLAVVDGPALGGAPVVAAEVVLDDQFLGVAVIGQVGPPVSIEVRHDERRNPLFRGDGFDAEPGIGRQLVQLLFSDRLGEEGVGLAGLVVENIYLGAAVVDDDQVVQPVAVKVRGVQKVDDRVDGEDFLAGEPDGRLLIGRPRAGQRHGAKQAAPKPAPGNQTGLQHDGPKCHHPGPRAKHIPARPGEGRGRMTEFFVSFAWRIKVPYDRPVG